jgi:predicted aldo/keto reductase-like oxidoreductase
VDTAIIGMTDLDELEENLRASTEPLSGAEEKLLAQQRERQAPFYCRMCGTCGGVCERGVRVADTLRILSYADGYGKFALARERYLELPAQPRCADCTGCTVECPNGVAVRARLERAQGLLA